ncbi:MAG: hypothetical protein OEZ06_15700 [Myxococcales bacterium]|nr:hypothetical protein [Myxococcales bacterium]
MNPRALAPWLLCCGLLGGCGDESPSGHHQLPPPPSPVLEAADWASHVQPTPAAVAEPRRAPPIHPAVMRDDSEDSDDLVAARRLVYRVSFIVPPGFRSRKALSVSPPAGELHVDLSIDRLRARFVGSGWPVDEGAQVRLRRDVSGVYLFDGLGGRSLGPGQLAAWFAGNESGRSQSRVRVRREFGARAKANQEGPAELMCALLAEWTNQSRDNLSRRCSGGSLPPGFRFGPWGAELTAVVPLELPRYALRADEVDAPAPIEHRTAHAMLDTSAMARIERRPGPRPQGSDGTLHVVNNAITRAIVLVEGVPVGWVDGATQTRFEGLRPGTYEMGALRSFGLLRSPPRMVEVPGRLRLGPRRPQQSAEL